MHKEEPISLSKKKCVEKNLHLIDDVEFQEQLSNYKKINSKHYKFAFHDPPDETEIVLDKLIDQFEQYSNPSFIRKEGPQLMNILKRKLFNYWNTKNPDHLKFSTDELLLELKYLFK